MVMTKTNQSKNTDKSQHLLSSSLLNPKPFQLEGRRFEDWELGKIKLFLLTGRIASGKSTVARELKKALYTEYPDAIIRISGFAYGVKDIARRCFGWDGEKDVKGRRLLQVIGMEAGREYNPDIWVKLAYDNSVRGKIVPPNIINISNSTIIQI